MTMSRTYIGAIHVKDIMSMIRSCMVGSGSDLERTTIGSMGFNSKPYQNDVFNGIMWSQWYKRSLYFLYQPRVVQVRYLG